jgi:H+-translocating NAD(P) transhydrogenase subunit alpha
METPAIVVGVPRERAVGEPRVALTPDAVERLAKAGIAVLVEPNAGVGAGFEDERYRAAGAEVAADASSLYQRADVIARVAPPDTDELALLRGGTVVLGLFAPFGRGDLAPALAARGVTAFALERMPRITRAQSMDVLSSQATVAGYRAALLAAERLPRFFPLLMTAAGTVRPAKVLVLGAGVAGLQAIATARRLGAVVSAFDVRAAAREQVESLGATFVAIELPEGDGEGAGGYAKELSEEAHRLEQELVARHVADSDAVITTALIPGRPAPILITRAMVQSMHYGSVIVDLAADAGGNCEAATPGETTVVDGVTIVAPLQPATGMAQHASQLYARNVATFLQHLCAEGPLTIDLADEIVAATCIAHEGATR